MANVREFNLINEKGQSFSLMDIENYCLLTEPDGLGYAYETEYEQLNNIFITSARKIQQGAINGVLNFYEYDNYKKLIDFIENSEKLKFLYRVPFENSYKEYYKDIEIQSITKTQKQENGIISESIIFNCMSLWYEQQTTTFNMKATNEDEIRWDFKWDSKFSNYNTRKMTFVNKGHTDSPIQLEIEGSVVNPKIQLFVEGELVQEVPFTVQIAQYEKFLYGTKEGEFYVKKQNTNGTKQSLFNDDVVDIDNDNVLRIPKNKSCEIRLSATSIIQNAKIEIFTFYKAV